MSTESIRFFAATDVGVVRDHNEDNFLVDKKLGLFIVADGMGGHAAGEVASAMAVRTVHEEVKAGAARIAAFAQNVSTAGKNDIASLMEHAVQTACAKIHDVGSSDPNKRGMGTTLSALLVIGGIGFIAHVGDSRIYMTRDGVVQQVTEDHTVYNELIRKGKLNAEQLKRVESKKNALMRAVGVYERVDVDTLVIDIVAGDAFVLASDGLTQYLTSPDELLGYATGRDAEKAPKNLCELAKQRGGSDNITVILVQVVPEADEAASLSRATQVALKRAVLAKVPIFARLDQRELLRVMQVAETRTFAAGDVLIREGERGDELYIVLTGKVMVSRGGATLTHLGQGQNFGEMALIRSVPRSATVVAEEYSETLVIHRTDFFELLRREHQLGLKMLWAFVGVLADRLDQTSGELRDAKQELAAEEIEAIPDTQEWNSPFSVRGGG
ncbi:MAG: cyclic nucleotide-binding domain-containing protein [Polyangiaceae bacterium]